MFDTTDLENLKAEAAYSAQKWGSQFDDNNTLNDWVTYICMYVTESAKMANKEDRETQYAKLIKVANLALTAAARVRNMTVAQRHYDKTAMINLPLNP